MDKTKKYVIFRHLNMPDKGKCFFTTHNYKESEDKMCRSFKGELWYEIIDYADTVSEAQKMCNFNYGGLPSQKEFEDYAKQKVEKYKHMTDVNKLNVDKLIKLDRGVRKFGYINKYI